MTCRDVARAGASLGATAASSDSGLTNHNRKKRQPRSAANNNGPFVADSGFVVLQGTTYWTDLFVRHFLFQEERSIDCDDLLFFVRKRHVKGSSRYLPKYEV